MQGLSAIGVGPTRLETVGDGANDPRAWAFYELETQAIIKNYNSTD